MRIVNVSTDARCKVIHCIDEHNKYRDSCISGNYAFKNSFVACADHTHVYMHCEKCDKMMLLAMRRKKAVGRIFLSLFLQTLRPNMADMNLPQTRVPLR